ncbi:Uronate isomerase [Nymphon striatum]|nr:Uronate isomerase [Nymphon striatum]
MYFACWSGLDDLGIARSDGGSPDVDPRRIWKLFAQNFHLFRGTPSSMWLNHSFEHVFDIDIPLNGDTADEYYDHIDRKLADDSFRPRALFERFGIECLATTEGALDGLESHKLIKESGWSGRVITTYRPDAVVDPEFEGFAQNISAFAINGDDGPLTSHVPFLLSNDGKQAELHLVRSNPIARACRAPLKAVITVNGPDSYISPDWYGIDDQVPTWNYVAIRISGTISPLPQAELHLLLDRLSAHFEEILLPKTPWTSDKMSDGVMERMMRQIQPFQFDVTKIEGTWKLGQNKPNDVRIAAADRVASYGVGQETTILSALMHGAQQEHSK